MKRAQLQGTPWHYEQLRRTCKDGSKFCIYNKNICVCKCSQHYHKKCVGKARYSYTNDEIEKMFSYLQRAFDKTKDSFKQEDFMEEFKW